MRWIARCLWLLASLAIGTAVSVTSTTVVAQELAMAGRGPRFLVNAPAGPVPVDVRRTPVLSKRISLDLRDVPLDEALKAIIRASGLRLGYSRNIVPMARTVRLVAEDITVAGALSTVLFDTGIDVLFSSNQAALVKRPRAADGGTSDTIGTVAGRVTSKRTGAPIAGATVILTLPDSSWHRTTSDSGTFLFSQVPRGTHAIAVRYIGYRPQTKKIVLDSVLRVDFALEAEAVALDELVTTATGQQRRRDLGNSITTIRADSVLQTAPIRNLTDLLEDRVPGLNIQHTSGAPGDPARMRLRGISSVMRGNDPVVIVDGVRVYSSQSDPRSGNLGNLRGGRGIGTTDAQAAMPTDVPAPSPLDQIDPNIIEKIEVFKGPSAATLYGADAANGVVVITTKRGKPGPTQWSVNIGIGRTNSPGRYPEGYYQWGHQLYTGSPMFCTLADLRCMPDSLARFQALNDADMTVLGQGERTSLSLTGSGGSQALTYSITGSYSDETGLLTLPAIEAERFQTRFNRVAPDWMRRPHQLTQWSVTSNVTARLSPTADVTLATSLSRTEQQRSTLERQLASLSGTYIDRASGLYYQPQSSYRLLSTATALQDYYTRTTASSIKFTTGLNATWQPRSWFNATAGAGLDVIPRRDETYLPAGMISPVDSGAIVQATGRSLVSTVNVQGQIRKPLGWGFVFETGGGANLLTSNTSDLIGAGSGLTPGTSTIADARLVDVSGSENSASVFGWYVEPRIIGQRLSLSTGIRLDGGSSYGTRVSGGSSLLRLPKLNGSWVISEEPFFPFKSLFTSLRLRGAYGQAQVQPGPTDRLRIYTRQTDRNQELLRLTSLGNSQLRPERSTEFEGGFDADLLDGRVTMELTAYRKMQVDALMPVALPVSVNGGGTSIQNIGNILNRGIETTLGVTPLRLPMLTWSMQLNYSRNYNELVKLGTGVEENRLEGIVEGYPVRGRWARPILGYGDANGNNILQPDEIQLGDSLVYMGQLLPKYQATLHTNVALFNGAIGITAGFNYESGASQVDETARTNWVLARALIDGSTPLGEQAAVLVYDSTDYGLTQEISTFRFNEVSVSYRAPTKVARLLRANMLTISLQGRNLGLHSTYRGKDPDVSAWSPSENIADTGQLPQPRTWQLAVFLRY